MRGNIAAVAALLGMMGMERQSARRFDRAPAATPRPRPAFGYPPMFRRVGSVGPNPHRPASLRERVRHAARADGLLLHQVLADDELVERYGAQPLRRAS